MENGLETGRQTQTNLEHPNTTLSTIELQNKTQRIWGPL